MSLWGGTGVFFYAKNHGLGGDEEEEKRKSPSLYHFCTSRRRLQIKMRWGTALVTALFIAAALFLARSLFGVERGYTRVHASSMLKVPDMMPPPPPGASPSVPIPTANVNCPTLANTSCAACPSVPEVVEVATSSWSANFAQGIPTTCARRGTARAAPAATVVWPLIEQSCWFQSALDETALAPERNGPRRLFRRTTRLTDAGVAYVREAVPGGYNTAYASVVQVNATHVFLYHTCGTRVPSSHQASTRGGRHEMDSRSMGLCGALSTDGGRTFSALVQRAFPARDAITYNKTDTPNAYVWCCDRSIGHTTGVAFDPSDAEFPFKAVGGQTALSLLRSRDGLVFEQLCPAVVGEGGHDGFRYVDSLVSLVHDGARGGVWHAVMRRNDGYGVRCLQRLSLVEPGAAFEPVDERWRRLVPLDGDIDATGGLCGIGAHVYSSGAFVEPASPQAALLLAARQVRDTTLMQAAVTFRGRRWPAAFTDIGASVSFDGLATFRALPPLAGGAWPGTEPRTLFADPGAVADDRTPEPGTESFLPTDVRLAPLVPRKNSKIWPPPGAPAWTAQVFPTAPDFSGITHIRSVPMGGVVEDNGITSVYLHDFPTAATGIFTRWTYPTGRLAGWYGRAGTLLMMSPQLLSGITRTATCLRVNYRSLTLTELRLALGHDADAAIGNITDDTPGSLRAEVRDSHDALAMRKFTFANARPVTGDVRDAPLEWRIERAAVTRLPMLGSYSPHLIAIRFDGPGVVYGISRCKCDDRARMQG